MALCKNHESQKSKVTVRSHMASLTLSFEHIEETLNALPDLLFVVDSKLRFLDYRAPQPELLYAKPQKFLGKTVDQVLPRRVARVIKNAIHQASKTGRHSGYVYSLKTPVGLKWFELSIGTTIASKKKNTTNVAIARDITDRMKIQDKLKQTNNELQAERESLNEKNIALKQILEHLDNEKQQYKRQICKEIEESVIPTLAHLKQTVSGTSVKELEALESSLREMAIDNVRSFRDRYAILTMRELEICKMVAKGYSSKQIAEGLNLSLATVHKHREHIRKKAGITNKKINLGLYFRPH